MGGESLNLFNGGFDLIILTINPDWRLTIKNLPTESSLSLIADKENS